MASAGRGPPSGATLKLFDSPVSSSAFRVRIALNLKGLAYERIPVDLEGHQQTGAAYLAVNPVGLVPALVVGDAVLTESLAIIEYLDESHPEPPLLPAEPCARARVRSLALAIATGIQPLHTERTEIRLEEDIGVSRMAVIDWCRHWIATGMDALERRLVSTPGTGVFCHGDKPTLADAVLVPAVYAARRRFGFDVCETRPTVARIFQACMILPAFQAATPRATAAPT